MGGVNHGMESLIKNEAAAGYNWTLTDTPLTGTEQNIIKKLQRAEHRETEED